MSELFITAALAGSGVALISGPLGAFVVWRRMAYFGDTLAHASLLGIALAIGLNVAPGLAIILVCMALALLLVALEHQRQLAADTLLGILSHSALALGIVVIALIPDARISLEGLLFGDLLAVNKLDVQIIWIAVVLLLALLWRYWKQLLAITVHQQLARVEGVAVTRVKTLLMLMLALLIALAIKVVGVLLITALLVIPAATARKFATSPENMAAFASLLGIAAVFAGLGLSWQLDSPPGPSIVLALTLFFIFSLLFRSQHD